MAILFRSNLRYQILIPLVLLLPLFQQLAVLVPCSASAPSPNITAFIFGDSLVDTGNNNYLASLARADDPPNGIDYLPDHQPTGRFSNARTMPDILVQELGLEFDNLPYMAPTTTGNALLRGVNYASGGGGILEETGIFFIERINFDMQLDNFADTRMQIATMLGVKRAQKLLRKSLFSVTIGANDFINNYLIPVVSAPERAIVSPTMFVETLMSRLRHQLKRLYDLDARKILVTNLAPIGCIPSQTDANYSAVAGDGCVEFPNQMARLFNDKLRSLLPEIGSSLKGSHFVYADVYRITIEILRNYRSHGFEVANSACCKLAGQHGGLLPCGFPSYVCPDRSKYVFWDAFHPSEAMNLIVVKRMLDGGLEDISPMNVRKLMQV